MTAVILAFAMTGCIALSAVSDLVSNFLSLVVMVIARIILQFCDLIMNPLLEITQMTTEEVAHYIPGFAMSGNGIGGYFSQAIMVISTTIAGALIAVRIISYLMETADGARTESVPKLIWNAVFGMVLTLTGSHFLQLMFDEIISPLTTALSEGVTGGGLGEFSFEDSGMKIIGQTESGDAAGTIVAWMGGFSIVEGASLVVSVVFLFLIWWNLIKLVLECAERYIICVFTILLSPLAFATATNERTKDTAVNWMQMFWSQCVLLILNIWVVGIARTALNIGLVGASVESVVKWGLVTYAYLKIAQKLDDMLAKAGFRITSTTGLDPMSEAAGAFRIIAGAAHDVLDLAGSVAGHGRAAADAIGNVVGGAGSNSKPIAAGVAAAAGANGAAAGAANNLDKYGKVSYGDKEKADRFVRGTNAERSDMYKNPGDTFNSNSNRQAMANALDELGFDGGKVSQGTVEDLAPDNAIKGAVNGKVTYRDENGKITGVSGFRYSSDESGMTATKTSDLAISPDGQSAILTTDKGKFRLENTGRTAANGSQEWTATRMTDGKGRSLGDVIPDTKNSTSFSVPAGQLNKYGADGAAAIAARSAMESKNLDYLTRVTDSALNKHDQEQAAAVTRDAKQAEAQKQFDTAKENYAGRFQMSNEQRAAEMRNPDSAVDYNSQESLAAMQDTLANADPELAEQFAKGAKVTGIDMAMGRDDMPDGALTVTVSDGNTTDTYMVSNPKGSLTDEEAAQVIASGRLPKGTAEGTGASENVTGDAGNATMVDGDATAKKTDATAPDENGQIAYNSLADDDSGQEVTGAEVGDTVGMTPEAFEATHTPVAAMDEPEPEATSFWGRVASVFSGHHGNSESSEPGVVNPDTVAQGGTTDAVPTGSGVPTPQTATATTTATGATGSANAANTAHGTTINTNGVDNAAAGNAESRTPGANNVNVVNPDAVTNGSGSVKPASTPAGAPVANGTATSKPINAANVTVTGASASGNASGTSTNVPQAKSGNSTPTNATVEDSATPLVHDGNTPISGGGTATNKGAGPAITPTPEATSGGSSGMTEGKGTEPTVAPTPETTSIVGSPAGKNGAAPEQGISTVPAGGNGAAPATTPTPETAPTAKGQGNVPSANVNTVGEDNTAPAGTAGTTATKATAPVLSNAGTLPTEPTTSGSETAVAPGTQAQNVSAKPAPGSEPQSESEISAGGNGAAGEGNTVVIASPAQGGNVPQTKDAAPSGHVEMETSADSSVTSTVTQSAGEDSVTNSSAAQTETVVDGTGTFSESSVGSAMQSATDKTVTEEGPAPTTTPVSPDSSDFAANDSTVSVESPTGSAPSEEFAGPAEQTTSYGSADAEFGGSNTPSDIGVVNENAGSTDSETQFANDSSAAVQTHTPASQADNAATNDNVSDDASVDYAEPPADAGGASNDVAAPSAQRTDSDDVSGEGNTGFAGGNGGGDNYSSDEETAPTAQGVKAPADEDDSGIGEPPAKGESSSNVGAVAGHAAPSADGDGDDFDDSDVGSASFGGSNGSSHDENPGSDASSGSGEETSNDDATAPTVQHQNVGNNSHNDGSSSGDNGDTTVSAPSTPAPEIQGGGAVSSESAGSDNDGSAGQTAPAASVTENTAPAKATSKATAEASRAEDNPAPAAQNFNHGGVGEDTGDSGDADGSAARKQPAEKPPVDGTQFYADTSRSNSFTEAGTFSDNAGVSSAEPNTSGASNGPEIRPLSHLSIKAFNDTNGFVESDGIGRIQVTRVSVDPDTGITQWRIMQKLDADGNVPEAPDVMNIERSAKYNKQTRRYEPETFESIARQLGKVDDYESVGPDTDESYKRRNRNSSQDRTQSAARSNSQPQQKNAYEGKSFRESNSRNERNNRFQQMMQGNKNRNGSKNKKDKPSK
jgi:hypothetical protein